MSGHSEGPTPAPMATPAAGNKGAPPAAPDLKAAQARRAPRPAQTMAGKKPKKPPAIAPGVGDPPKPKPMGAFGPSGLGTMHGLFPGDVGRVETEGTPRGNAAHGMSGCQGSKHALCGLVHGAHLEPDGDEGIPTSRLPGGRGDGDGDEIQTPAGVALVGHGFGGSTFSSKDFEGAFGTKRRGR